MPEHLQDVHFADVNLHIVFNLVKRSDPNAAVVLHFIVSLSVALYNCQPTLLARTIWSVKSSSPHPTSLVVAPFGV